MSYCQNVKVVKMDSSILNLRFARFFYLRSFFNVLFVGRLSIMVHCFMTMQKITEIIGEDRDQENTKDNHHKSYST